MINFLRALFDDTFYMPHGHCYFWNPTLVALHSLSDSFIALAYFSIPISIYVFLRKRKDIPFRSVFYAFIVFIASCGATHVMEVWTLWHSTYWLSGSIKAITATASVLTAVIMVPLIPRALQLKSLHELERMVNKKTSDLKMANESLQSQIEVRKQVELELSRRANDLIESNKELEQFAYVASHDLKEPLRKIISYAGLLQAKSAGRIDEEIQRCVENITDGATRMGNLINDLLAYSRARGGEQRFERVDLEKTFSNVVHDLESAIKESGAVLTHDPLPVVNGTPFQMHQLMQNLISNALRFRREEPPRVHLSARRAEGHWIVSVRDNGIGIEPEYIDRIFKVFQRLHGRDKYPGTGIGLAICKKIVERHGGRIWVESKVGQGSTFFFSLPEKQGESNQPE